MTEIVNTTRVRGGTGQTGTVVSPRQQHVIEHGYRESVWVRWDGTVKPERVYIEDIQPEAGWTAEALVTQAEALEQAPWDEVQDEVVVTAAALRGVAAQLRAVGAALTVEGELELHAAVTSALTGEIDSE